MALDEAREESSVAKQMRAFFPFDSFLAVFHSVLSGGLSASRFEPFCIFSFRIYGRKNDGEIGR